MQHRKGSDRARPEESKDHRPDRMEQSRQTRRNQRMDHAQRPKFHEPRRNLRRTDQGSGGDRRRRAGAGDFEEARQMRCDGAGDKPGRCKHESKDSHRAARRRRTLRRHLPNSLDERNHMPGVLRSETRMNWFACLKNSEPPTVFENLFGRVGHCQYRDAILRNWFQP